MTWIKLDDKCPRHPKVAGLSDRAFRWWVISLCYASEFLTDGKLPLAFFRSVPIRTAAELTNAGLWVVDESGTTIHDYLAHQTGRADIEKERARNRQRRTGGKPPGVPPENQRTTSERPRPEAEAEIRVQRTDPPSQNDGGGRFGASALIRSPLEREKALRFNAFAGSRLDVPTKIHRDFVRALGGVNPDGTLMAWYAELDAEVEASGEAFSPDVWKWLEARFKPWLASRSGDAEMAKFLAGGT